MHRTARLLLVLITLLAPPALAQEGDYEIGLRLYREGRHAAALESFQRAALAGATAELHTRIGWTLYQLGRLDEARGAFTRALALEPEAAEALTGLGDLALRADQPEAALAWLDRALAAEPASADARTARETALRRLPPPARPRPEELQWRFRAGRDYLEVREDGAWTGCARWTRVLAAPGRRSCPGCSRSPGTRRTCTSACTPRSPGR